MTVLVGTIQKRRDTAANWASINPVLLDGEQGLETDTKRTKTGNGTDHWNTLEYDYEQARDYILLKDQDGTVYQLRVDTTGQLFTTPA